MNDVIKVIILSIIEGITEFLPISSTGHLILANEFVGLEPKSFADTFSIIIQLGAIMSVVVIYFKKLNPFDNQKKAQEKTSTINIWKKVIISFLPAAVLGFLFDDIIEKYLFNPITVSIMLFIWGIFIVFIEKNNNTKAKIANIENLSIKQALLIGLFQCLAMIPGTSRSAATIIGAMLIGMDRKNAAEFSFFLAIPTMMGATGYKVLKMLIKGVEITNSQIYLTILGMILSFIIALVVIKKFMGYIQKNSFKVFGIYRIILAVIVLLYFTPI